MTFGAMILLLWSRRRSSAAASSPAPVRRTVREAEIVGAVCDAGTGRRRIVVFGLLGFFFLTGFDDFICRGCRDHRFPSMVFRRNIASAAFFGYSAQGSVFL